MALKSQVFTSSGTWTAPAGVTGAWVTMLPGGSQGTQFSVIGGGGGTGEIAERVMLPNGGTLAITIGARGIHASGVGATNTGVGPLQTIAGPLFNPGSASLSGWAGGGCNGAARVTSPHLAGTNGSIETNTYYGGNGGGSGNGGGGAGGPGAGSPATTGVGLGGGAHPTGAGGGAATLFGGGGNGSDGTNPGTSPAGTAYGAAGGGGAGTVAGDGVDGIAIVFWLG